MRSATRSAAPIRATLEAFMDLVNGWLSARLAGGAGRLPQHGAGRRDLGKGQPRGA